MADVVAIVTAALGSPLALGGLYWSLKTGLTRALDRTIDAHKAELQRQTDAHKAALDAKNQDTIERLKAELSAASQRELENVKHRLQLARAKLEATNKLKHEVYAELHEKLRIAEGAIGSLFGLAKAADLKDFSEKDLTELIQSQRVTEKVKKEVIAAFTSNPVNGLKEVKKLLRRIQFRDADEKLAEAKNHLVLKALYATDDVGEMAWRVVEKLAAAYANADVLDKGADEKFVDKFFAERDASAAALNELKALMRKELAPPEPT